MDKIVISIEELRNFGQVRNIARISNRSKVDEQALAKNVRKMNHRQWEFMEIAYGTIYDLLAERGEEPTIGDVSEVVATFLEEERQRRFG